MKDQNIEDTSKMERKILKWLKELLKRGQCLTMRK